MSKSIHGVNIVELSRKFNLDKEKLVNCFNFKKEEIKISIA